MMFTKTVEVTAFPGFGSSTPIVSRVTLPAAPWEAPTPKADRLPDAKVVTIPTRRKNLVPLTNAEVIKLLASGPKTTTEIREATGRTEDSVRHRLCRMHLDGFISSDQIIGAHGGARLWRIAQ